jgi:2,4-dienoyl-CoA reductase-like NADH-dependent reductase (Old Yellow Enzyme family)
MNAPDPLLTSFELRGLTLRNRIVMSPMTRGFSPGGIPGPDVAAYCARRAERKVGLIITEGVGVDHPAALGAGSMNEDNVPVLHGDAALAGWQRVVDSVHRASGEFDLVAVGRSILGDPDWVTKVERREPLQRFNLQAFATLD